MKQKIPASAIVGIEDFAGKAAAHAVEIKAWRAHMRRVTEDKENGVTVELAHAPYPRPRANPLVERAVNENDEANFEIVDDGPTEAQKLAAGKATLIDEVLRTERSAKDAIAPATKLRFYNLRENDIRAADARRREAALSNVSLINKLAGRTETVVETAVVSGRPPEDTAFLAEQVMRRQRFAQIERIAAQAMHDIEDLTAETISGWKAPSF